ncbi:SDR family NAD(P)-dependent oxidoreductase (plasmid) [Pantoea sp. C3]|uniref:SDR family NAD(P)-dependent oxidoreductase n=1 Tax=Pantoea phytostimulans TaxID=2769024 RepID=UPI0038F7FD3A
MTQSFQKKIAVITGASSGIGLGIAQELSALGATVIITGRDKNKLELAVSTLGPAAYQFQVDVSSLTELNAFYEQIRSRFGRIDILIANAGMGEIEPLGQITPEKFDLQFTTNVRGITFTVQKALPLMKPGSSIVITGSTASINPGEGLSVYGGTKAALRAMVRSWILDIKGAGIRINILSPGPVDTQSLRDFLPKPVDAILQSLRDRSPIGRIGRTEEIAKAVIFLASDDAGYINGAEIFADGGASQT